MEEKEKKKTTSKKSTNQTKNTTKKTAPKAQTQVKKKTTSNARKSTIIKKGTPAKKTPSTKATVKVEVKKENVEPKTEVVKEIKVETPKEEVTSQEKKVTKDFEVDYLTITVLVIAVLLVFFACAKLFGKEKVDYSESYLVKNKIANQISCSDIPNALQGTKSYIFITNVGTEEEYLLEKKMATIIQDKKLKEDFYVYFYEESCDPSTMKLTSKLEQVPAILYYRDGQLIEKGIREDKTMLQDGDLARIVDIYEE